MFFLVAETAGRPKNGPTPKINSSMITSGTMVTTRSRFTPKRATTIRMRRAAAKPLESAGSSIGQLLQVRVYIADVDHWASFNQIYARWAGEAKPARAVVPVSALHFGLQIEIEATALA